jgi:hypothetical protein
MTYGSLGVIESAVSSVDGPSNCPPVLTTSSTRRATCLRGNTAAATIGDGLPLGKGRGVDDPLSRHDPARGRAHRGRSGRHMRDPAKEINWPEDPRNRVRPEVLRKPGEGCLSVHASTGAPPPSSPPAASDLSSTILSGTRPPCPLTCLTWQRPHHSAL